MRFIRGRDEGFLESEVKALGVGVAAGLLLGALFARTRPLSRSFEGEFRQRARGAVRRLRPARLQRLSAEQEELEELEDAVLNRFLADSLLSERAIDIGAISPGIIELSGVVNAESEADRAVSLANATDGVTTVVNRLEVEEAGRAVGIRGVGGPSTPADSTFVHYEGRVGGMGRRRQGPQTDPDRPDDSQALREEALAAADRDQWRDEDLAHGSGVTDERPEVEAANPTAYSEEELDNQDPHGKHARRTLDEQPQALNPRSRVGEPPKPGIMSELRDAEVPLDLPERDRD